MNFEEILNQWEAQTQQPYGKKRIRKDLKNPTAVAYALENTQTLNPMDYWVRRYGVYDKDADNSENTSFLDNLAERRRLRAMRPQAEIDLHGMTLEEAYGALVTFFEDAVRMAVCLGADADTLGAIVGSIAEAIWGIPMKLHREIETYLPEDMRCVILDFRHARPSSFKPLIDTTYGGNDFSNVSWDILYDMDGKDVYEEEMEKAMSDKEKRRKEMTERGKARNNW